MEPAAAVKAQQAAKVVPFDQPPSLPPLPPPVFPPFGDACVLVAATCLRSSAATCGGIFCLAPALPAPLPAAAADEEALEAKWRLAVQAIVVPIRRLADIIGCGIDITAEKVCERVSAW